jgi:hypothetical protein
MGGALVMPHFCTNDRIAEHAEHMIASLPAAFLAEKDLRITSYDIETAQLTWNCIIEDKDMLSVFFDKFFQICAEYGDSTIAEAHGKGLKTKSKFIVTAFSDSLKLLRMTNDARLINKAVKTNCRSYLHDFGLRVPQYIIVDEVMLRTFDEFAVDCVEIQDRWNASWNDVSRLAWRKIVTVIVRLLIRVGLQVEAELSPEELAHLNRKTFDYFQTAAESVLTNSENTAQKLAATVLASSDSTVEDCPRNCSVSNEERVDDVG